MGASLSPYPFALAYPQDDHERFLIEELKKVGVGVEWGAKLTSFQESDGEITATIEHRSGQIEEADASYVCGCDGHGVAFAKI